jgi:putative tricarboxylic transport membrane protein
MADESGGERGTVARMEPMRPLPAWVRWARWIYLAFAWVFVGCVLGQVFLAGLATFVDPARWLWHTTFIHFFEFLPILMLPFAFLARLPVLLRWLTGALYALIWLQYFTANFGGIAGAFHPVNALLLFWIAVYLGQRAWRAIRDASRRPQSAAMVPAPEVRPSGAKQGGIVMRSVALITLGLVGGFFVGIVLSEIIGVIGYLAFGRAVGIKFLALYLAAACAILAPIVDTASRRRAR